MGGSNIEQIKADVTREIKKQLIPARVLLTQFSLIDGNDRKSLEFQDPRFYPFFYHLGKFIKPKTMLEIGFNLGMASGCFLKTCKSVDHLLAFQRKTPIYFSSRFGFKNLKRIYNKKLDFYNGSIMDEAFLNKLSAISWDFVIFNDILKYDEYRIFMETIWSHISVDGYLLVDHCRNEVTKRFVEDFSKIINREHVVINTRNGTALYQK